MNSRSSSSLSMSMDDTFFSENEESQSDIFSSDGYSVVFGPGEASDITMPFTDMPSMHLSGITIDGMVNTMVKSCTYPKISAEHVNVVNFELKKGYLFKVADTTIHLIGAPTKERAMRILDELGSIFPGSLSVNLRWWVPVSEGEACSLKPIGYNPIDNTFFDQVESKNGYDGVEHTVFVLYYCDEAIQDTTEAFNRLIAGGQVPPPADSIILPLADYLLDPTAHLCSKIPASLRSPLVEVEVNGHSYRVPFTVSLLETLSADQLLRKGGRVVSLSYWNGIGLFGCNNALVNISVILSLILTALLTAWGIVFFLFFRNQDCIKFFNPLTWKLLNSNCGASLCEPNFNAHTVTRDSGVKASYFNFGLTSVNNTSVSHSTETNILNVFLDKTKLVTDITVSAINAATVSVALAVSMIYEYLSAQVRSFGAYVKRVESLAKDSEKVRQYKQYRAESVSKAPTCESTGLVAYLPTPFPTTSCASLDISLYDVLEAHANPVLRAVQSSIERFTSFGLDHLMQAYNRIAPKFKWLTHPKHAWRDDLVAKIRKSREDWFVNVGKSYQEIKHQIQQTGRSVPKIVRRDWSRTSKWLYEKHRNSQGFSKAQKWFLDKYGKRDNVRRVSEAGYKRARAGFDWMKRKVSQASTRPLFRQ